MYTCICIVIAIDAHVYAHTYIGIHMCIHTHIHELMHTHKPTPSYTYIHTKHELMHTWIFASPRQCGQGAQLRAREYVHSCV